MILCGIICALSGDSGLLYDFVRFILSARSLCGTDVTGPHVTCDTHVGLLAWLLAWLSVRILACPSTDVLVFEYGRIPPGDRAAASFKRVHFFRTKFGWRVDLILQPNCDGQAKLVRLSRSKKSTIPQSTVRSWSVEASVVHRNGGYACGNRPPGEIPRLVGGEGMTNW